MKRMRLQRSILILFLSLLISSSAHAYIGVKMGLFNTNNGTHYGGGLIFGVPLPVPGLGFEAEATGYYADSNIVDFFFMQTLAGLIYDFNPILTPDSDFLHPYVRGGLAYGFIFSTDSTLASNDNAPGFYTGAGINLKFPVVTVGLEANYTYLHFGDGYANGTRSLFLTAGLRF